MPAHVLSVTPDEVHRQQMRDRAAATLPRARRERRLRGRRASAILARMKRTRGSAALAVAFAIACTPPPAAPEAEPVACHDLHDCASGEICVCRGVSVDPCMPGMSERECDEARCGGRICASPDALPPSE